MWQSFGIQPLAAAGHSIGEYVAATLAGVFSLEDAARLVAARGRLIASLPAGGGMSAVLASEKDVLALLAACGTPERTGIAAVNGSTQTVLSGPLEDLVRIADKAGSLGISIRHLPVSHAFHSSLMDPILDDFARVAESIAYDAPGLPVVSNVTGRLVGPAEISGADYWVRHIRSTVRFFDGFRTLRDMAPAAWLELGPSGVLTALCRREQALENSGEDGVWVAAMHAGTPEWRQTCEALAALYRSGADVDWAAFAQDQHWGRLHLPLYPFQGERHWVDDSFRGIASGSTAAPAASQDDIWQRLTRAAESASGAEDDRPDGTEYREHARMIETFCSGYALEALTDLGAFPDEGFHTARDIAARIGLPERFDQLLPRLLENLAEQGLLARDAAGSYGRPAALDRDLRDRVTSLLDRQEASGLSDRQS